MYLSIRLRERKVPLVQSVQQMLHELRIPFVDRDWKDPASHYFKVGSVDADGAFGWRTQSAVLQFQESVGLVQDGVVGPSTLAALEEALTTRTLELHSPTPSGVDNSPDRFHFAIVNADVHGKLGSDRIALRHDVAEAWNGLRKALNDAGGTLTASAGRRSLRSPTNADRSPLDLHYLGRAFDLNRYAGMLDPAQDPYVVTWDGDDAATAKQFRVWARVSADAASQTDSDAGAQTLDKVVTYGNRSGALTAQGHFIDFTKLAGEFGFTPVPPRPLFRGEGRHMGALWWQFEYHNLLVESYTTYGRELLHVYSQPALEGTAPWSHRDRIYGVNWCPSID